MLASHIPPSRSAAPIAEDAYVARQPIFDMRRELYGYELLFRNGIDNAFPAGTDVNMASAKVLADALHVFGLSALTGPHRAFFNVSRSVLVGDLWSVLPVDRTVVELLETVEPDPEVIAACVRLRKAGYTLALDDFVLRPGYERLLELAQIVKIDYRAFSPAERRGLVTQLGKWGVELLAEKVETPEEFAEAREAGYRYVQGYFFSRPEILKAKAIPTNQAGQLRFLRELNQPELDFNRLEGVIRQDVSISLKLLRYLNSAAFGWRSEITTLKQALVLLGEGPFRRWAHVVTFAALGGQRDAELVNTCLVRARLCELLAGSAGLQDRQLDLFFTGLLSGTDALVGQPLPDLLDAMQVAADVRSALLQKGGPLGLIFSLVLAYERGLWEEVDTLRVKMRATPPELRGYFIAAAAWARHALAGTQC